MALLFPDSDLTPPLAWQWQRFMLSHLVAEEQGSKCERRLWGHNSSTRSQAHIEAHSVAKSDLGYLAFIAVRFEGNLEHSALFYK